MITVHTQVYIPELDELGTVIRPHEKVEDYYLVRGNDSNKQVWVKLIDPASQEETEEVEYNQVVQSVVEGVKSEDLSDTDE